MRKVRTILGLLSFLLASHMAFAAADLKLRCSRAHHSTWTNGRQPVVIQYPQGIQKPKEVASFLAWVKSYFPEMYNNTKDFPVDFWQAVLEQESVQDLMHEFPVFQEFLKNKSTLLSLRIQSPKQTAVQYDFPRLLSLIESKSWNAKSKDELNELFKARQKARGSGSFRNLLNDLVSLSAKEDIPLLRQNLSLENLLEYFAKHGGIPAKFRGASYDLSPPFTIESLRERALALSAADEDIENLRLAIFVAENSELLSNDPEAAAAQIEAMPKNDLKMAFGRFKIKPNETPADASSVDLILDEAPNALAMFKNCVGIECTPPRFALLPHERAIIIRDAEPPSLPKGYLAVSAIQKTSDGQKALLFRMVQGPRISANDLSIVLSKAAAIAKALGFDEFYMSSNSHTNYSHLGPVWSSFIDWNQPEVPFRFLDHEIRGHLDIEPKDEGGIHHSEAMIYNSSARVYRIPDNAQTHSSLQTTATLNPIPHVALTPPSRIARLEAGIAYARFMESRAQGQTANVFYQLGLDRAHMTALANLIKNPMKYSRAEFEKQLLEHAVDQEGPLDPQLLKAEFSYLIEANAMRFADSFAPSNEAKNVPLLIKKVKALRFQLEWQWNNFVNLQSYDVPILKSKILELAKSSESTEDLKVVKILVSFLADRHLDPSYAQQIATTFSRHLVNINKDLDPEKKSANIKMAGFGALMKKIYPIVPDVAIEAVRENIFEWKLNYFHNFIVDLRAPFFEYRNAVLWNLKSAENDERRSQWFIKEDVLTTPDFNRIVIRGEYSRIMDFTAVAREQIVRKLREFCAKNATTGGCSQFLRDVAAITKEHGIANYQNSLFIPLVEELLQSLPEY